MNPAVFFILAALAFRAGAKVAGQPAPPSQDPPASGIDPKEHARLARSRQRLVERELRRRKERAERIAAEDAERRKAAEAAREAIREHDQHDQASDDPAPAPPQVTE